MISQETKDKLIQTMEMFNSIKDILLEARNKVYRTANFAMVEAYWNIGKTIIEEQKGKEKAGRRSCKSKG